MARVYIDASLFFRDEGIDASQLCKTLLNPCNSQRNLTNFARKQTAQSRSAQILDNFFHLVNTGELLGEFVHLEKLARQIFKINTWRAKKWTSGSYPRISFHWTAEISSEGRLICEDNRSQTASTLFVRTASKYLK